MYFFTHLQVNDTNHTILEEETVVPATFFSFNELTCKVPSVTNSYEVRISNSGNSSLGLLSNSKPLLIFNSLCTECDATSITCRDRVSPSLFLFINDNTNYYFKETK